VQVYEDTGGISYGDGFLVVGLSSIEYSKGVRAGNIRRMAVTTLEI